MAMSAASLCVLCMCVRVCLCVWCVCVCVLGLQGEQNPKLLERLIHFDIRSVSVMALAKLARVVSEPEFNTVQVRMSHTHTHTRTHTCRHTRTQKHTHPSFELCILPSYPLSL